ncbi:MAG: DUF1007 family protein, partial [Rhodobacteraceae bacterium]|nr:DUF1007 family protein [Paracoccaceae bacterium]
MVHWMSVAKQCARAGEQFPTARPPRRMRAQGGCARAGVALIFNHMFAPRLALAVSVMLATATPLGAHPHIFVDAGLRLRHDPTGALVAVEVTWRYDALYSLLLVGDYVLDPDHDMILTEEETAAMLGFDLNWGGGFEGGLVLGQAG